MNIRSFIKTIHHSSASYPDIFEKNGLIITCVNPFSYHIMRNHKKLYDKFDNIYIDGITMCWWIRWLWGNKIPRLSFDMSGMAADLFSYLNSNGTDKSIYFLGTEQNLLEATINQFKNNYPNMKIKGYRNGFFNNQEDRLNAIDEIIRLNTDFTIIGMGSPLQEQFAIDVKNAGYQGIVFTCGGFLHQSSKSINYYPYWINKYNLRAFYRLFKEKGLFKRLYNVLIEFPVLFTWDTLSTKLNRSK